MGPLVSSASWHGASSSSGQASPSGLRKGSIALSSQMESSECRRPRVTGNGKLRFYGLRVTGYEGGKAEGRVGEKDGHGHWRMMI